MFSDELLKVLREQFAKEFDEITKNLKYLNNSMDEISKKLWDKIHVGGSVEKAESYIAYIKEFERVKKEIEKVVGYTKDQPSNQIEANKLTQAKEICVFCKGQDVDAKGIFHGKKLSVLKGSKLSLQEHDSLISGSVKRRRELERTGLLERFNSHFQLNKDQLFDSPSAAANFVLGRSANGWTEWKDNTGKELSNYR